MKTGIQISSLKPLIQTEETLRETCGKIAALGCGTVQLQWLGREIPADTVAEILRENGMEETEKNGAVTGMNIAATKKDLISKAKTKEERITDSVKEAVAGKDKLVCIVNRCSV